MRLGVCCGGMGRWVILPYHTPLHKHQPTVTSAICVNCPSGQYCHLLLPGAGPLPWQGLGPNPAPTLAGTGPPPCPTQQGTGQPHSLMGSGGRRPTSRRKRGNGRLTRRGWCGRRVGKDLTRIYGRRSRRDVSLAGDGLGRGVCVGGEFHSLERGRGGKRGDL